MKVTLRYFAGLREALGTGREQRDTQASTVGALRDELIGLGGAYADSLAHGRAVRLALNQTLVEADAVLTDGAEVAFFPPVTGG